MIAWKPKTSRRRFILLISCLAMSFPSIAGAGACEDKACCSSAQPSKGLSETQSQCCCCAQTVAQKPPCCEFKAKVAIEQSCTCQVIPPSPQPYPASDKTEESVSGPTLCQLPASPATTAASVHASLYNSKISPPNNPEWLLSVMLLI